MFKLPSLFKSKDNSSFLLIDIGSDVIKVLACKCVVESNPVHVEVVGMASEPISPEVVRGGVVIDVDGVVSSLRTAVINATHEFDDKPVQAIFGLSGDLSLCILTTVKVTRGKLDPISADEVEAIHIRIHEEAQSQAFNQIMESSGNSDINIELITSSVVYTKLDGQPVQSLVGRVGQEVEIALFNSFTPSFNTEILQEVAKHSDLKIMAIASEMYSLVRALKLSKGEHFDAVVIDMGSDITDFGIVFGGGIVATKTLPLGGRHITGQISNKMGLSFYAAEEKKLAYSYGNLNDSELVSVQDAMERIFELWLSGVELVFSEFTGIKTFASKVFLVGGGVMLPDIKEILTHEPWTRSIPFKSPPEFVTVTLEDLTLIKDNTGKLSSPSFIPPASLAIVYLEMNGYLNE